MDSQILMGISAMLGFLCIFFLIGAIVEKVRWGIILVSCLFVVFISLLIWGIISYNSPPRIKEVKVFDVSTVNFSDGSKNQVIYDNLDTLNITKLLGKFYPESIKVKKTIYSQYRFALFNFVPSHYEIME